MSLANLLHFPRKTRKRTEAEIATERDTLLHLCDRIPPTTAFGQSNLAALRAGINVIIKRLTYEEVEDEYEEKDDYIRESAIAAAGWLWDGCEAVSEAWEDLAEMQYGSK
jgi:hypothetical protein